MRRWMGGRKPCNGLAGISAERLTSPLAPAPCCVPHGLHELRHLHQGGTVLGVVGDQLVLPALFSGPLPACPPHQTLEAGSAHVCPGAAEEVADFLQTVGECGEVHAGMNGREYVHRPGQGAINEAFPLHDFPHPAQQRLLVASVVEQGEVLEPAQEVQEGVEHLHLLVRPVRPEGVRLPGLALRVTDSGKKTWTVVWHQGRQTRRYAFGAYPAITLVSAREKAQQVSREDLLGLLG